MTTLDRPACHVCGRTPARQIVARRHLAMLLVMRTYQVKPTLCREHATKLLLNWTSRTLVEGWWGPISLFVANPATILLNLFNLARARSLDPPHLSSPLVRESGEGEWWGASRA